MNDNEKIKTALELGRQRATERLGQAVAQNQGAHKKRCLKAYEDDVAAFEAALEENTKLEECNRKLKENYDFLEENEPLRQLVIEKFKKRIASLEAAIESFLDVVDEPPAPNCSCFISPPCHDCLDHSGAREAFKMAREALNGGAA